MKTSSFRWLSSPTLDVDAYLLETQNWFLFAHVKEELKKDWVLFSQSLRESFPQKPVLGISGAQKTKTSSQPLAPCHFQGKIPSEIWAREKDLFFRLEVKDILNPGLFLDQSWNRSFLRQKLKESKPHSRKVLNLFSFTGAFSVVAAKEGAQTISIDLHKRYLNWEKKNLEKNQIQIEGQWVQEDARKYLEKCFQRHQTYDFIILDPPTFSHSGKKPFQIQRELLPMAEKALPLLNPEGALLISAHTEKWSKEDFFKPFQTLAQKNQLRYKQSPLPKEAGLPSTLKSLWLIKEE